MKKTILLSILLMFLFTGCKKKHTTDIVPTNTGNATLDESFGENGKLFLYNSLYNDFKFSNDGKIILKGQGSGYSSTLLCSIFINGIADTYFGDWGRRLYNFPSASASFEVLPSNDIMVLTDSLVKINKNGDLSTQKFTDSYCLLLSNDKLIGVGGDTIKRYNADYTKDLSFIPFTISNTLNFKKILESKEFLFILNFTQKKIYKLLSNGAVDNSFAGVGFLSYQDSPSSLVNVEILNEKIYICHPSSAPNNINNQPYDLQIKRYDINGKPDVSFGSSGTVLISAPSGSSYYPTNIMISGQNDIYVYFSDYNLTVISASHLVKLNNDGQVYSDFGTNGNLNIEDLSYATCGKIKGNYIYLLGNSSASLTSSVLIKYKIQ